MKLITILCLTLVSLVGAEEAQTKRPPLTPELTALLKATNLSYTFGSNGTPTFEFANSEGTKELVYVNIEPFDYGNYKIRQVMCVVYQGATKPSESMLLDALLVSSTMKSSRFQLGHFNESTWILAAVGLFPDSGDGATLKQLIEGIVVTASDFRKRHSPTTAKTATPPLRKASVEKEKTVQELPEFRKEYTRMMFSLGNTRLKPIREVGLSGPIFSKDATNNIEVTYTPDPQDGSVLIEINFIEVPSSEKIIETGNLLKLPGAFSAEKGLGNTLKYQLKIDVKQQKNTAGIIPLIKTVIRAYDFGIVLTSSVRKVDNR